jgi:cytochrome c oxidase assembly protein subunit 15
VVVAVSMRPRSRPLTLWSVLVLAQIPVQAVIGGITVLTNLNPWVVGLHFLASMAVIAAAYQLWVRTGGAPAGAVLPRPLSTLTRVTVVVTAAVLAVGTVVTGSGPHAGDAGARRTGLDPQEVSQLHADLVFLLLGLSAALWFALRAVDAPAPARRAAAWFIGIESAQGVVGFVQYFTHLPVLAVGLHMLGAAVVWVGALAVLEATRPAPATPSTTSPQEPDKTSNQLPPALTRTTP